MKFMAFVIPSSSGGYEQGAMPTQEEIAAMMKYNEELAGAGIMLGGDGMHPTSKGARINFSAGKTLVVDGPFTETKEIVGGYWIWKVNSKEEAIDWARRSPLAEGDAIVLRQVFDMEDFGDAIGPDEAAAIDRIDKQVNANVGQTTA